MIPLIPLITALTPLFPLIAKGINIKKGVEDTAKTTGQTEILQLSYTGVATAIFLDVQACGSLACVSHESWGLLVVFMFLSASRYITKLHANE